MASRFVTRSFKNVSSLLNASSSFSKSANLVKRAPISSLLNSTQIKSFSASAMKCSDALKDLNTFLNKEIKLENEVRKNQTKLPQITGFEIKADGPNVTLTKSQNNETITVTFTVNGSLDGGESNMELNPESESQQAKEPEAAPLKARPNFSVDIKRGNQTLSFGCSFLLSESGEKVESEDFNIDEFAIHEGDWNEKVYTADASVLDGDLYDLLLNVLDERGVGEKFANELSDYASAYDHHLYINLLEKIQNFSK